MKDVQRDIVKLMAMGLTVLVILRLVDNAGGVARIVESIGGVYTGTLDTLARA